MRQTSCGQRCRTVLGALALLGSGNILYMIGAYFLYNPGDKKYAASQEAQAQAQAANR